MTGYFYHTEKTCHDFHPPIHFVLGAEEGYFETISHSTWCNGHAGRPPEAGFDPQGHNLFRIHPRAFILRGAAKGYFLLRRPRLWCFHPLITLCEAMIGVPS